MQKGLDISSAVKGNPLDRADQSLDSVGLRDVGSEELVAIQLGGRQRRFDDKLCGANGHGGKIEVVVFRACEGFAALLEGRSGANGCVREKVSLLRAGHKKKDVPTYRQGIERKLRRRCQLAIGMHREQQVLACR